jgi:hypothetical protein
MDIIPTPHRAQELRQQYADNHIVKVAENALRAFGEKLHASDAVRLLPTWRYYGDLSEHEVAATLARFVPPPSDHCGHCGYPIRYDTEPPDAGWWKHTEFTYGVLPHAAVPHYDTQRHPGQYQDGVVVFLPGGPGFSGPGTPGGAR